MSNRRKNLAASEDGENPIKPVEVRYAAMNLLARREHSKQELLQKLQRRYGKVEVVAAEIQRLCDEGLQSDQRFAESFFRHRAHSGYGPLRIRQEMRYRGVSDELVEQAQQTAELNWYELAGTVFHKKFGGTEAYDVKDKAKRSRFMQYRGFSSEHYQHLLSE